MTNEHWVDLTVDGKTMRQPLPEGLTRLGGPGADLVVPGAVGELHLWSSPPKLLKVGDEECLALLNGHPVEDEALADGDRIQFGQAVLVYGRAAAASVQELPVEAPPPKPSPQKVAPTAAPAPAAPAAPAAHSGGGSRFTRRLHAGVLADLKLANNRGAKRWQEAVMRGEFDADSCARDLLEGDVPDLDDPRVLDRAGRLQRDLLMMPFQRGMRGAGRRARMKTRQGMAYVVANVIAITVYSLVLVAIMILVRVNYDFSFDTVIDSFLDFFR